MSEEEEQKHSQLQAQQISQAEIWELLQEKSIIFFCKDVHVLSLQNTGMIWLQFHLQVTLKSKVPFSFKN